MVVNVEFLGEEPIENIITCMHFRVDKVIYFGYQEMIDRYKYRLPAYLKKYCGVEKVAFYPLKKEDMQAILTVMRDKITDEQGKGHSIYFDITGGDSLILVAFGMLSKEFDSPMHVYDIVEDRLIEINDGSSHSISQEVESQEVKFDIDKYIEMMGGIVNYNLHKAIKGDGSPDFVEDVEKIWEVASKYAEDWNLFSNSLKRGLQTFNDLDVDRSVSEVRAELEQSKNKISLGKINSILDELENIGIINNLVHANRDYMFSYKNQEIRDCLRDGGCVLELHIYHQIKSQYDDCRVGVHVDWDGIISDEKKDVLNEVDILALKGNIPTFISCKSGKMGANSTLHALYELQTVEKRFGGKYSKKVLVSMQQLGEIHRERAEEMGIEIW